MPPIQLLKEIDTAFILTLGRRFVDDDLDGDNLAYPVFHTNFR